MYGNAMALIGVCKAAKGQSFLWLFRNHWRLRTIEVGGSYCWLCHCLSHELNSKRIKTCRLWLSEHSWCSFTDQFVDNGQNRYQTESKKWIKIPNFLSKFQLGWLPPTPNLRDRLAVFFEVTELVLSIYTRRERVPEAEELLLCSSHTTLEVPPGGLADFWGVKKTALCLENLEHLVSWFHAWSIDI